jgi:NitT/TauT family transport system substrate-binding protein
MRKHSHPHLPFNLSKDHAMFRKFVQQDPVGYSLTELGSTRREFLTRGACLAGAAALGGAYLPQAMAAGPLTLKATHGTGLCKALSQ